MRRGARPERRERLRGRQIRRRRTAVTAGEIRGCAYAGRRRWCEETRDARIEPGRSRLPRFRDAGAAPILQARAPGTRRRGGRILPEKATADPARMHQGTASAKPASQAEKRGEWVRRLAVKTPEANGSGRVPREAAKENASRNRRAAGRNPTAA